MKSLVWILPCLVSVATAMTISRSDFLRIVNVAQNKPVLQSSYDPEYGSPDNVVDGEVGASLVDRCMHTGRSDISVWTDHASKHWLQVDLGKSFDVQSVVLSNRLDCCEGRLQNFDVVVSDRPYNRRAVQDASTLCVNQYRKDVPLGSTIRLDCQGGRVRGRYVTLVTPITKDALSICELQVLAQTSDLTFKPLLKNVALKRPATQSSSLTSGLGAASLAVDGNSQSLTADSCSQTRNTEGSSDPNHWWQVSLGALSKVQAVAISNREDCCEQRLDDLTVVVTVDPFNAFTDEVPLSQRCVRYQGTFELGARMYFRCAQPIVGRYVTVITPSNRDSLSLCEVEVLADPGFVDPCTSSPCKNGGNCSYDVTNGYKCACPAGRFTGAQCETRIIPDWKGSTCSDNSECTEDNAECFKGDCLCSPGYYYSVSTRKCLDSCPDASLHGTYTMYKGSDIKGSVVYTKKGGPSVTDCNNICNTLSTAVYNKPVCRSYERKFKVKKPLCYLHSKTPREVNPKFWTTSTSQYNFYMRNCN